MVTPPNCARHLLQVKGQALKRARRLLQLATAGAIATGSLVSLATPSDAATVLVRAYEHQNYGGTTLDLATLSNGYYCTAAVNDFDASWPITGYMNDRMTSFVAFRNCRAMLFEHSNFSGVNFGLATGWSKLPDWMNDRTSAVLVT